MLLTMVLCDRGVAATRRLTMRAYEEDLPARERQSPDWLFGACRPRGGGLGAVPTANQDRAPKRDRSRLGTQIGDPGTPSPIPIGRLPRAACHRRRLQL
jgi:hypothetical protein